MLRLGLEAQVSLADFLRRQIGEVVDADRVAPAPSRRLGIVLQHPGVERRGTM